MEVIGGLSMKKGIVFLAVLALVAAACGGSDDAEDAGAEQAVTTTQPDPGEDPGGEEAPPETSAPEPEGDSEGSGPSTATVTIGEETFSFSTEGAVVAQCLTDFFGVFSSQLPMVDDGGAQTGGGVAIVVLQEGTDPDVVDTVNSVEVDTGDETWVANEADDVLSEMVEPGMSQVDSVEIDGRTVRGTATFVRQGSVFGGGEVETMTGTFEATCGEERSS